MQTQWYKSDLYCSKEIKEFLLKLACGQIEACEAQKIAGELYGRISDSINHEQIKSKHRIKQYGEVYTNLREINGMLSMLPDITIDMTFLEPACGNGNFVIEILKKKFNQCKRKADYITALKSVYAIDILADNIEECKDRVKSLYHSYGQKEDIDFILDTNIFQGNSLAIMSLLEKCQCQGG